MKVEIPDEVVYGVIGITMMRLADESPDEESRKEAREVGIKYIGKGIGRLLYRYTDL